MSFDQGTSKTIQVDFKMMGRWPHSGQVVEKGAREGGMEL